MKTLLAALGLLFFTTIAMAETQPLNLSLTPEVSLHDRDDQINGLTLSIWGENPQHSLAIGLVNGTVGDSSGLSIGILNYGDSYRGVQWGLVNYASGDFSGWQGGFFFGLVGSVVNGVDGRMSGFQCGVVNYAGTLSGFQLGILNYAANGNGGLQIGLINIIKENQVWFENLPGELAPAMILVNWRF